MNIIRKLMNWSRSKKRGGMTTTWTRLQIEGLETRLVPSGISVTGLPAATTPGSTLNITVTDIVDPSTSSGATFVYISGVDAVTGITMNGVSVPVDLASQIGEIALDQDTRRMRFMRFMHGFHSQPVSR